MPAVLGIEAGLGGYSLQGQAWHFSILQHFQRCATINLLERIVAKVGLQINLEENTLPRLSCCILTMTNCKTAKRWMHRSIFREKGKLGVQVWLKHKVSHEPSHALIDNDILGYFQWFPGNKN